MKKSAILLATMALLLAEGAAAETMPLLGRVSIYGSFQSTSYQSGISRDFSEFTAAVSFRTPELEGSGVEYAVDMRGSAYPSSEGRSSRTRVFDAWAGGRTAGGRLTLRAGQMWLQDLGGIGALGGVMAEMRKPLANGDLRFGVFAGMEPERYDFGFVSNVKKGGAWIALDGKRARRHVLGYVQIRDEDLTERSVVTTTNYIPAGRNFFVYMSGEYDLTGPGGEGNGGLNYVFANARFLPASRVELLANYHHGRSIDARTITQDILEGRPISPAALEGFLYESAGGRVTVEVIRGVRIHAGYARDRNDRFDESFGRISAGIWASNVAGSGIDVTLSDNRSDRPDGSFDAWYASVGRSFGSRLYLSADYATSLSLLRLAGGDGTTIETRPRTKRYGLSANWNVNRSLSFLLNGEQYKDDSSTDDRGLVGLTWRF